jgi:dihydrofolate reductase
MRKVIARVFDYSFDGVIATEDTEFYQFCRDLPDDPAEDARGVEFYAGADLHIMGRVVYQGMADYFPDATGDPNADVLNAARKVVFSRTQSRQLELLSSVAFSSGLQLGYRLRR